MFNVARQTILPLIIAWACLGCESGGSGPLGEGHDFGPNDPNYCVAIGDSITEGDGLASYAESWVPKLSGMLGKNIANDSSGGSTTGDGVDRVHDALDTHPGFLLILYGVNDLIMGYPVENAIANLNYMIQAEIDNKTIPVIATLTPVCGEHVAWASGVKRLNADIRNLAAATGTALVDLEEAFDWNCGYLIYDGLHPNAQGHDVIAASFDDVMR